MKSPPMLFMHDFFLVVVFSFLSFVMVNSIAAPFLVQAIFLTRDQHPTYPHKGLQASTLVAYPKSIPLYSQRLSQMLCINFSLVFLLWFLFCCV